MALLGKGLVSDESNDTLCCADIKRRGLPAHTPRSNVDNCINLPIEVSAVVPQNGRWFNCCIKTGICIFRPARW